jgi:hypothetical protein
MVSRLTCVVGLASCIFHIANNRCLLDVSPSTTFATTITARVELRVVYDVML